MPCVQKKPHLQAQARGPRCPPQQFCWRPDPGHPDPGHLTRKRTAHSWPFASLRVAADSPRGGHCQAVNPVCSPGAGKGGQALAALAEISDNERPQPERPTPTLNTWSTPTGVAGPVTSAALSAQPHWLLMVTMLKATSIIPHGFSFCLVSALMPWK